MTRSEGANHRMIDNGTLLVSMAKSERSNHQTIDNRAYWLAWQEVKEAITEPLTIEAY